MQLKWSYWYFRDAIPENVCDHIIKEGLSRKKQIAKIGHGDKGPTRDYKKHPLTQEEKNNLFKIRNSEVVWLDERWIYKEIHPFIHEANREAGWNFQWDFSEAAQFTFYSKKQHYTWHRDGAEDPYDNLNDLSIHGKIRKISSVLLLSDSKDFKGGELQFAPRFHKPGKKENIVTAAEVQNKGGLIVFPSFLWHRVKPVISGTRHSLPMWHLGKPFV